MISNTRGIGFKQDMFDTCVRQDMCSTDSHPVSGRWCGTGSPCDNSFACDTDFPCGAVCKKAAIPFSPLAKGGSRGVLRSTKNLPQPLLAKEGGKKPNDLFGTGRSTRPLCGTGFQPVIYKTNGTGFQPVSPPLRRFQPTILPLAAFLTTLAGLALSGCATTGAHANRIDRIQLKHRSLRCLQRAIQFHENPAVRLEAVEAFQYVPRNDALPWIRTALDDQHPAVRFAACVALGRMNDAMSLRRLEARVDDENASVQVAALFALHRLGHRQRSGEMPTYLLRHDDTAVRRNAALLLGMLDDTSVVKVMARAMTDPDEGVRHHALEAMARLGNGEARRELTLMTRSGVGSEEVFAITALAGARDRRFTDTFRYKLHNAAHLETRLAAARALGDLGIRDGLETATRALTRRRKLLDDPNDPPEQQILRARQMAAAALGAIGSTQALPHLAPLLDESVDLRIQVSAAAAILQILSRGSEIGVTFPVRVTVGDD